MDERTLKKFFDIFKREFGVELSETEVLEKSTQLIELYRAVYSSPMEIDEGKSKSDGEEKSNHIESIS